MKRCLEFDFACVEFVEEFERAEALTVEVPLTDADKKKKATKLVPAHSPETLLRMLGIDVAMLGTPAAEVDPAVDRIADEIRSGRASWL